MRRRLWLLDFALVGILIVLGFRYRDMQEAARDRAARNLNQRIVPEKAQMLPPVPAVSTVTASNYADVAIKMLFAPDRNPTVIVDPVAPPPEKPMPPLPTAYGAMFFGEPSIILSVPGAQQRAYHKGEVVGAFTLVDFDNRKAVFEWEGKTVERRLDQIMAAAPPPPAPGTGAPAPAPAAAAPTATATTIGSSGQNGPGQDVGGGSRACVPGDSSPSGTVRDGYRKVEATTPFGKSCVWQSVK